MKTWPAALALWLVRRGAISRGRALFGAAMTLAGGLIAVQVIGSSTLTEWWRRTRELSEQDLVAYSAVGLGRHLFTDSGVMEPLALSPVLHVVVTAVLVTVVVLAIAVTVWRPGTDSLAMWNIATGVVLLLPVSHLSYRLLALPLVWVWCAYALRRPREFWIVTAAAASVTFWLVTFRLQPPDSQWASSPAEYVGVMAASVTLLVVSVAASAVHHGSDALPTDVLRTRSWSTTAEPPA